MLIAFAKIFSEMKYSGITGYRKEVYETHTVNPPDPGSASRIRGSTGVLLRIKIVGEKKYHQVKIS